MQPVYQVDRNFRLVAPSPPPGADLRWMRSIDVSEIGNGVRLNHLDFTPEGDHHVQVEGPPSFCLAVFLEGQGSLALKDGPSLTVTGGTTVLCHTPRHMRGENTARGGSRVHCLDFRFEPELLAKFDMPAFSALVRSFPANCSVHDALLLGRPTTQALARITQEIIACRMSGMAKRVFLYAKALEALSHVISLADRDEPALGHMLSRADRERVLKARELLHHRFDEPWTIAKLARAVAINEKKLKAGFRTLVGTTIHAYLEDTRLSAAAQLMQGGHSVTETALACGYANPSHFAKQFRQRHGLAPRAWLRQAG